MQEVIYIDILIVSNILITYLLLLATSRFLKTEGKSNRMLAGSFLGGIYSLIILAPDFGFFLSLLIKLLLSLSIVTASFKPRSLIGLIRSLLSFFLVNFTFAGLMFAIWMIFKPSNMQYKNGSIYFNFSFISLIVTALIAYISIFIFNRLMKEQVPQNQIYNIKIKMFGKEVEGKGFLDTGNNLTDGFMGTPVIIAKKSFVFDLLPKELETYFDGDFQVYSGKIPKAWQSRIRLVPTITLNAQTLLPSFRPDMIIISDKQIYKQVIIAVCNDNKLNMEYDCLLNADLLIELVGGEKSEVKFAENGY